MTVAGHPTGGRRRRCRARHRNGHPSRLTLTEDGHWCCRSSGTGDDSAIIETAQPRTGRSRIVLDDAAAEPLRPQRSTRARLHPGRHHTGGPVDHDRSADDDQGDGGPVDPEGRPEPVAAGPADDIGDADRRPAGPVDPRTLPGAVDDPTDLSPQALRALKVTGVALLVALVSWVAWGSFTDWRADRAAADAQRQADAEERAIREEVAASPYGRCYQATFDWAGTLGRALFAGDPQHTQLTFAMADQVGFNTPEYRLINRLSGEYAFNLGDGGRSHADLSLTATADFGCRDIHGLPPVLADN